MWPRATPATQSGGRCRQVRRLPRKIVCVQVVVCVRKLGVSKLGLSKLCVSKLCVSKLCKDLYVDKLCVCGKLGVIKLYVDKVTGWFEQVMCGQVGCE